VHGNVVRLQDFLVSGVIVYLNTSNKREVTASTVLAILGGVLILPALSALG